jgi:pimeloyl-ACP methyl ester carboxylesterase
MQVVVQSLVTEYERAGGAKKPKLLILHGWGDNLKGWKTVTEKLQKKFEVVVVDLPGFGGTAAPKTPWKLDDYVDFVRDFLKKIRFSPQAIIGHSNGGAIAVRGLANGSLDAERLVLIDSAGIRGLYNGRNRALRMVTKTGKLVTKPLPANVRKRLRRRVYDSVGSDMLVAEHLQETFKQIVTDDIQFDAAQLKLSTLLIYGEDDLAAPPAYGRILHNLIGNSRLELIPSCGHFAHLDCPDKVIPLITDFLS